MIRRLLLTTYVLSFSHALFALTMAEQEQQYKDSLSWAQGAQQSTTTTIEGNLTLNDYCADPTCIEQVKNPPQAGLNSAEIDNQKTTEFFSNDTAKAMQDNFDKGRPDPTQDPSYEFALIGQEHAYDISHGNSNPYVDCDSGTQCITEQQKRQCNRPTLNAVPCHKVPTTTVTLSPVIYTCPSGWSRKGVTCKRTIAECRYSKGNWIYSKSGDCGRYDLYFWDGVRNSSGKWKGEQRAIYPASCGGENRGWNSYWEICRELPQTQPAQLTCKVGYTLSGANCIKNTFTWNTQCSLLESCHVLTETCIEGRETRTINGVPTTLDCWKYQVNHQCDVPDTCAALAKDCQTQSSTCSLMQNGICIEDEIQKTCPVTQCSSTNLICGETSFCLDGDCYDPMPETSSDFDQAASGLAALAEAAEGLGDPPLIFTGKGMKCTDNAFGFADCCKNGGWGTDLGLSECSEKEVALGQAKEQGTTIYLGSYCADRVLGACVRRKKTYCVFDSKLSRIIQEQGTKSQLGISLGSPKNPVCGAITPEQLQQINFEHIDFSDFYEDMQEGSDLPDPKEVQDRLQSAYGG